MRTPAAAALRVVMLGILASAVRHHPSLVFPSPAMRRRHARCSNSRRSRGSIPGRAMPTSVSRVLRALVVALALATAAAHGQPVEFFSPRGEVKAVRQVTARFAKPMVPFGDPRELDPFTIDCLEKGS